MGTNSVSVQTPGNEPLTRKELDFRKMMKRPTAIGEFKERQLRKIQYSYTDYESCKFK
jgi:hypothetical protein